MPAPASAVAPLTDLNFTIATLKLLAGAPAPQAIGIACAFLLDCATRQPDQVRRALNEPVIHQGFRGTSLLAELQRVAR